MNTTANPKTCSLNVRVPEDLLAALQHRAQAEDRTVSSMTRRWLTAICSAGDLVGVVDPRSFPVPVEATPFDGGRR